MNNMPWIEKVILYIGLIGSLCTIFGISIFKNRSLEGIIRDFGPQSWRKDDSTSDIAETEDGELVQEYPESHNFSRTLYTLQEANGDALGDKITFNSIKLSDSDTNWYKNKTGEDLPSTMLRNETNFVGAREDTGINSAKTNLWEGSEITVEDDKTYVVRIYVHNNNPNGEQAVAENTQVRFYIPYDSSDSIVINGQLRADNADPDLYIDDVTFKSKDGQPFHLEYVYGSALLENGKCASDGIQLADSITNQGNTTGNIEDSWTAIGYDALDGKIPGCYQYINYVTIRVKVVYDYEFSVLNQVRLAGNKYWFKSIEAKVGDKVEFQITYQNLGKDLQENVLVRDVLPHNLRYIENSTKLSYIASGEGKQVIMNITDGAPSDITKGINIGKYDPTAMARIMFAAEVVDNNLKAGKNTLLNRAQSSVNSKPAIKEDSATILIYKQ